MAQRYVPKYVYAPGWGWYFPRLQNSDEGLRVARRNVMPRPTSHFGFAPPAQPYLAPTPAPAHAPAPAPAPAPALAPAPAPAPASALAPALAPAPTPAKIASTSTSAVHTFSQDSDNEEEPIAEDNFPRRKFKLFGFLLSILSSFSISFGLSNVVVTALVVIIPSDSWGCLQPDSSVSQYSVYQTLGPTNSTMEFADWCWISVGIWASITVFISGNVAGSITKAFSHQSKLFAVFGLISVFIFLPLAFVFAILDAAMSHYCSIAPEKFNPQPAKFAMPLLVGIFSLAEIVLTIGVFVILRKELRKRKSDANESTSTPSSPASSPVHSPASTLTPSTGKSPASSPVPELAQRPAREPQPIRQQVFPTRNVGLPFPPMRRRPAPPYYNPMLEPPIRRLNGPPLYSADPRLRQFPYPNADQIPYRYNGLPRPTIYNIQFPNRGPPNPNRNPPQRYYPSRPTIPRPNVSLPPKVPGGYQDYREPYTGVNRNSGIFGNNFINSRLFPSMQGGKEAPNRAYTQYT